MMIMEASKSVFTLAPADARSTALDRVSRTKNLPLDHYQVDRIALTFKLKTENNEVPQQPWSRI